MARSMAFEDLATVVYVRVDDGYQAHAVGWRQGRAGAKPRSATARSSHCCRPWIFCPFRRRPGSRALCGPTTVPSSRSCPARAGSTAGPAACGPGSRPCAGTGRRPGGHPHLPVPAGHQAAARHRLPAGQGPQRLCGHGRLRGLCQPPPEVFRLQAGPALHLGGRACGLRAGAGLDGRAGCRGAGPGLGVAGPHPRRQGLHRGRLAAGLPGDPGPGDPDPLTHQPAHRPTRRLPAVAPPPAGTDRRRLPRGAEHRAPPGTPDLQDGPGLRTHVAARMASHALRLRLRRQAGIDVRTFTVAG